ncbi:serine/threonine-protein kinase [Solwaraspora sp. WMMD1047]|uniref:serine/threonine-protein kinase n=1 Tax=Solwaraspora sp. WMMD1047 TaxID=3016102 RepID=UPI00241790CF|nr:serine/threonine-protein kinase [Solwaraspora sp. WMMD1047]MDG4831855.1 serine/threonine-protein kinase [Solwaraspora sp. WMMD1047]
MTTNPDEEQLVPLGEGPVATVLAGTDPAGQAYALKVFPGRLDRRGRAGLDRELARLAALRVDAPVLVADRVERLADGRCALRMELCAQSLRELVDSFGPLTVSDAVELGSALCAALVAAHRAGVVHGAVTPGNVLFRASGEPLLADFGRTLRDAFPPGSASAVDFLAPETVRDQTADERTDLYGLGAVLYLALSGRSPHHGPPGEPEGDRLLRVLGTPVPPLDRPDLPVELARLVAALLAKDPAGRPEDAATVARRLARIAPRAAPAEPAAATAPPPGGSEELAESVAEARPHDAPGSAVEVPAPRPDGEPILVFGPERRRPAWLRGPVLVSAAAGALALLALVVTALLLREPAEPAVPPAQFGGTSPTPAPTRAVQLELIDPVDRGNVVELSWRSSEPLDFAIIVAAEGKPTETVFVHRNTSYRLPVDPVLRYCFLIQGVDGVGVYETAPKPIRGANCVGG